jgi:sugar phosphate isomerase/epimerase
MIKRRTFLINGGLALGALAIAPSFSFGTNKKNIGLQLYSLREQFPKDMSGTISKLAKAGYTEVETYGFSPDKTFFGTSVKEFNTILRDNGMKVPSGHYDFNTYIKDGSTDFLKSSIEAAAILESEYVVVPWLMPELRGVSGDGYKEIAQKVNVAAELCKASGLKLAYHNHDFEFDTFGSTTGYDILLKETDRNLVDFELDLYWVVRSGNDPLKLFAANPGRFTMWHVKDMDKAKPQWNTEIGKGVIDFKAIFAAAKLSGMKHFFIEHETNYQPNPMDSVIESCRYVKDNLI